jgi:hypothetical protein
MVDFAVGLTKTTIATYSEALSWLYQISLHPQLLKQLKNLIYLAAILSSANTDLDKREAMYSKGMATHTTRRPSRVQHMGTCPIEHR